MRSSEFVFEKWSEKYKSSINCSHPKGFSQKAHCAGKNKQNESIEMEMVCEACGMCETHGNLNEIKKGQKDSNGYTKCWSGYHAQGTKKSATTGKQVRNCVPNESQGVAEGLQKINWVNPNFDFEWHEVEEQSKMKQVPVDVRQYYQKHFPNKDAWLKAVQNGKAVVVPPDHAYEIRNAPFDKASLQKVLAPTGHEGPIGPAKEKRVNDLFDKGQVEMPIILKTSQGLWLIGGKTRLGTANYVKGLPAKVWLIGGKQGVAEELSEEFDLIENIIEGIAAQNGVDAEAVWEDLESLTEDELYAFAVTSQLNEDWQKANKRDRTDGMSQKAVNSYRREHPGSKLKTAVTTKPSKLKKGSKASKRRKSYCSRSRGQMKMHSISCAKTPDKAICKARRRWNC
jgi:hypothetical protein